MVGHFHSFATPGRMLDEYGARDGWERVVAIYRIILDHDYTYEMSRDDAMAILKNPKLFDLKTIEDNRTSAPAIIRNIDRHIYLGNMYLQTVPSAMKPSDRPPLLQTGPLRDARTAVPLDSSGRERDYPRNKTLTRKVLARDDFKCIITELGYPQAAHLFPNSAYRKPDAIRTTVKCWRIVATLTTESIHDRYLPLINTNGFKKIENMLSLTPSLHGWLDRGGIWSFYPKQMKDLYTNRLQFWWLPACLPDDAEIREKIKNGNPDDNPFLMVLQALDEARAAGFQPRQVIEGTGHFSASLRDGSPLKTGYIFDVCHEDSQQALFNNDMAALMWLFMSFHTFRGL